MNKKELEKISIDEVQAYKFSNTATDKKPELDYKNVYEFLILKYNGGTSFGIDNLHNSGIYRIHGWAFIFRPYLKEYWYRSYNMIYRAYAPNKTLLRESVHGTIEKIVEVK
jgi:hypothetical protein